MTAAAADDKRDEQINPSATADYCDSSSPHLSCVADNFVRRNKRSSRLMSLRYRLLADSPSGGVHTRSRRLPAPVGPRL